MKNFAVTLVLVGCFFSTLFSQTTCQKVFVKIKSTTPAIRPTGDGWIDLCLGDTLTLVGEGTYPQNDSIYHQSDSTSIFTWVLGDGKTRRGKSIRYVYTQPGAYYLRLRIADIKSCINDSSVVQRVRVKPKPNVQFTNDLNTTWQFCAKDTIQATFALPQPDTFAFGFANVNADTFFIPDGDGRVHESTIEVAGFPKNTILTDAADLQSLCLNIEHSWLGDLSIDIKCPNGQSATLHNFGGRGGAEVYLGEPNDFDGTNPKPGKGYDYCWTMEATRGTWRQHADRFTPQRLPAGDYQPFESLDSLMGCPVNGQWKLIVQDLWERDNGTIFNWQLNFLNSLFETQQSETFISKVENYQLLPNPGIIRQTNDTVLLAVRDSIAPLIVQTTDNSGCTFQDEQPIKVYPTNHPFCKSCDSLKIVITGDTIRCPEFKTTLRVRANVPDSILQFKWTDAQGNIRSVTNSFVLTRPDAFFVEVTNTVNGCTKKDTITFTQAAIFPNADAGESLSICRRDSVLLDGSLAPQSGNVRYTWSGPSILGNTSNAKVWVDSAGLYVLTVQDTVSRCLARDTVQVLPAVAFDVRTTTAGCDTATGRAFVQLKKPLSNYTISWSTGAIGDTLRRLAQGNYSVTVTSGSCAVHQNFKVEEDRSCKVLIGGYVYTNSPNCQKTTTSAGVPNVMLHLLPADVYTFTNRNGYYEFTTDPGNYTVHYVKNDVWELRCPQDSSLKVNVPRPDTIAANNHFFVQRRPVANLKVSAAIEAVRPGFETRVYINVCNQGNLPVDAVVEFVHDSLLQDKMLALIANRYNAATRTATWNFVNLGVNECRSIYFNMVTSREAPLNATVQNRIRVLPVEADVSPADNTFQLTQVVTGSFDPNDKQLLNGKNTLGGAIFQQDSILQYQIRFQNTGTDTAFTVVIQDTIDNNLQVESIRTGIASHAYSLEFKGKNVLVFRFENILLPDSTTNEAASHGFVTYSIKTRPGLTFGDTIRNTAAIYFDYNKPVITNTVENILTKTTGVNTIHQPNATLRLSPNPTAANLSIELNMTYSSHITLTLSNQNGQIVKTILPQKWLSTGTHWLNANLEDIPSGVYLLTVETERERISSKVVKLE